MLAVAWAVDVDADGVGGEAVEDGGGERGVAEVLAPGGELQVGGDGRRSVHVAAVEQGKEHMGRGRLVAAALELAEADVIDNQELGTAPGAHAPLIGAVGEARIEVVDEVDAAGVADGEFLLTGFQ